MQQFKNIFLDIRRSVPAVLQRLAVLFVLSASLRLAGTLLRMSKEEVVGTSRHERGDVSPRDSRAGL